MRLRAPKGAALGALGLLALATIAKLPTLSQPLTENFAWRQTQTAWTALIYHQEGIDLLHPEVPVHGPPWVFGFEFPLFQALGALLMDVGLPPDLAMRTLGLITFLITGWLLFRLLSRLAGSTAGIAALAAFLFSPFGLLWGRTSLIEYLATAAALGFLLAGIRWLEGRRPIDYGLAMAAGVIAMLIKITTGAFYLLPLLAFRPAPGRRIGLREWPVVGLIVIPAIIGRLWIAYTDSPKAASPATVYPAAMSPVAAMVVGLGAAWAWEQRRALLGRLALASGGGLWVITLILTRDLWMMSYEPVIDRDGSLAAAAFIRERTDPDDWVVVGGRGWDPTVLYYAGRRGYMLDERRGTVDDLVRLREDERYTLFVDCPYEGECRELAP